MAENLWRRFSILLLFVFLISCEQPIHIDGFSASRWKNDKDGCNQNRRSELAALSKGKSKIIGLSENQILSLLGKPDKNELYSRNQKFFIYNITPGASCYSASPGDSVYLSLRINAVGLASEFYVYENGKKLKN